MSTTLSRAEDRYQVPSYSKFPLEIVSGRGCWVETADGSRWLDFYGGHAVASTGHCHPHVVEAISRQAGELIFYSNVAYSAVRARAVEALAAAAPAGLGNVFLVNSGAEANDVALQLARRTTGKADVVSFDGGFHGRSLAPLSACGLEKYRRRARPQLPGVRLAHFNDLDSVAAVIDQSVAAVIIEPIQSMAGVVTATADFLSGLRELCDRHGSLLIYDEVQTGAGRTGQPFFAPRHGVLPDLLTTAKGIASGVPAGAVLMSAPLAAGIGPGDLGSTFGGGPLACAAISATLDVVTAEDTLASVRQASTLLTESCARLAGVRAVRGHGLLLGLELETPARAVQQELFARQVLTGLSEDPAVLRLLPPLTLQADEIEFFLVRLESSLAAVGEPRLQGVSQ